MTSNPTENEKWSLVCKDIPVEASDTEIRLHFEQYGQLKGIEIPKDSSTITFGSAGKNAGYCLLEYVDSNISDGLIQQESTEIRGQKVLIQKLKLEISNGGPDIILRALNHAWGLRAQRPIHRNFSKVPGIKIFSFYD